MQYRDRVIFIGQPIDEEFSNQILATMLYLDSIESSQKLYLYINGPGGDVSKLSIGFYLCMHLISNKYIYYPTLIVIQGLIFEK